MDEYEKVAKQTAYNPLFTVEQCYVAGLESFACAGEVPTIPLGSRRQSSTATTAMSLP